MRETIEQYRLLLPVAVVLAAGAVLYVARGVLVPFVIGGALAYLLYPAVKTLDGLNPWRQRRAGHSGRPVLEEGVP